MKTNTSSTSSLGAVIREFLAPLAEVVGELEPLHVPLPHAVDVLDAFVELRRLGEAGLLADMEELAYSNMDYSDHVKQALAAVQALKGKPRG